MAYDAMDQLPLEVDSINTGTPPAGFPEAAELDAFKARVDELADGMFPEQQRLRTVEWDQFAQSARAGQNAHFDDKPHVLERIKAISEIELGIWINSEMLSQKGTELLANHLMRLYSGTLRVETARPLARDLLRSPSFRVAKGIVRADLYSNWRRASRQSIPKDLVPDLYHVLNAIYCSMYATAEARQVDYASLLLGRDTQVAIYHGEIRVDTWLMELCT